MRRRTAVLTALILASCSANTSEAILGSWKQKERDSDHFVRGGTGVEFLEDGKLTVTAGGSAVDGGTWKVLEDGRLSVEWQRGGTSVHEVTFDGKNVTFEPRLGDTEHYRRKS